MPVFTLEPFDHQYLGEAFLGEVQIDDDPKSLGGLICYVGNFSHSVIARPLAERLKFVIHGDVATGTVSLQTAFHEESALHRTTPIPVRCKIGSPKLGPAYLHLSTEELGSLLTSKIYKLLPAAARSKFLVLWPKDETGVSCVIVPFPPKLDGESGGMESEHEGDDAGEEWKNGGSNNLPGEWKEDDSDDSGEEWNSGDSDGDDGQ